MPYGIKSLEHREYHEVHAIDIDEPHDPKSLSVRVKPPIPRWVYKTTNDIDRAIITPRYQGSSFGNSNWPTIANLCVSKPEGLKGLVILDIVELVREGLPPVAD